MAKNKENQAVTPEEENTPALGPEATPATPEAPAPAAPAPAVKEELLTLEELAATHRVAGWQAAALHKLMGWEPGKRVSDTAYKAGLERLKNRRIGG
jgi:hypothetical protein